MAASKSSKNSSLDDIPIQTKINKRKLQREPKSPLVFKPYLEDWDEEELVDTSGRKGNKVVLSDEK